MLGTANHSNAVRAPHDVMAVNLPALMNGPSQTPETMIEFGVVVGVMDAMAMVATSGLGSIMTTLKDLKEHWIQLKNRSQSDTDSSADAIDGVSTCRMVRVQVSMNVEH